MDITIYDVIQKPVLSDKASELAEKFNKIVLQIHPHANKMMVKEALHKLFNVEVKDVKVIVRKGKTRTFKRMKSTDPLVKRAIVTLKPGYSLDVSQVGESGFGKAETTTTEK